MKRTWQPSLGATCLPTRHGMGRQGLRRIVAKLSASWQHRMDLSAVKSPFPIPTRWRTMVEKRVRRPAPPGTGHTWRMPVAQAEVPEAGLRVDLVADERVRA